MQVVAPDVSPDNETMQSSCTSLGLEEIGTGFLQRKRCEVEMVFTQTFHIFGLKVFVFVCVVCVSLYGP